MNEKVYIHEFIDVIGQNRARYMHHMTANWCPVAREERGQLCYGVWGTLGCTGRWPEVVNIWEHDGWEGLADCFNLELGQPTLQDPSLAEWWAAAAPLRRGGVDRILVPAPWTRSIEEIVADGPHDGLYAHELVTLPLGAAPDFLDALAEVGRPEVEANGLELVGAFRVAMADDSECIAIWAIPDWSAWVGFERAWTPRGAMAKWRSTLIEMGAGLRRTLLLDSPLNPMRTGRQPSVADRRPLSDF